MLLLLVRSHFSLMKATASPEALCASAKTMGYPALALTDTNNLYGLWEFLGACRRHGIRPVIGVELDDVGKWLGRVIGNDPADSAHSGRVICLAATSEGFSHLCRLVSLRHANAADVAMHAAFSKTRSSDFAGNHISKAVSANPAQAFRGILWLTDSPAILALLHDSGFQPWALLSAAATSTWRPIVREARTRNIPIVAAADSRMLTPGEEEAARYRLLRAIDGNTTIHRLRDSHGISDPMPLFPESAYRTRFACFPEAIDNTDRLLDAISFTGPDTRIVMPEWHDPARPGLDAETALAEDARTGAVARYGEPLPETVVQRLEHEMSMIRRMGFCGYFLIVRDIVRQSPRTCGRGSGAASLVAYCLGITNVCPIRHHLYFERFLNPGRTDPPDIDVDFAWDERETVLSGVLSSFSGHAAMVSSMIRFQPRMALRETARAFGVPEAAISAVTRRLPGYWHADDVDPETFASRIAAFPKARNIDFPEPWPVICRLAAGLVGMPRHLMLHPGGVVITPGPIDCHCPVELSAEGLPMLQWDKDGVEDAGLVKIDLLGNRSLAVIRDALRTVAASGRPIDELRWHPEDDAATQATIAAGRTMGCFYIESPAMRLLQQKAGRGDFEHLVLHSSIIRPAANDWIEEYLGRLHGKPWQPLDPRLTDVLSETYGIMVYQEDVSRAAVAMAGFSHEEADRLRKVLSKKDRALHLVQFRRRFEEGARRNGVSTEAIETAWNMMMSFDGYSFCKPHSASYARVSFQAAYLKTHFPAEFMAAVLRNCGGFYSTAAYVSEARRMGLVVLGPDVNESGTGWTGRNGVLRAGLDAVAGLRESTLSAVSEARAKGPFDSVEDFFERIDLSDTEARHLIDCGAFDGIARGENRAMLHWRWMRHRRISTVRGGNLRLFEPQAEYGTAPPLPEGDELDRLRREYRVLGFLCDRHPLSLFRGAKVLRKTIRSEDLPSRIGRRVAMAAWPVCHKTVHARNGKRMAFFTFEDETGLIETVLFPDVYERTIHRLAADGPVILSGTPENQWGAVVLHVTAVDPLGRR
ncbi:DNA polymerase III subunit alpha [Desulfatirhabdium butyrativorans]|uniref:DNA polymerase III subunit alpha n=1 Tax=Desulfatirhabdium butyrativorans TaxID=340467 RepID=UPI000484EC6F|nr:DNA polymerase III subunit alpha [Desulfatirhabdium butyrativorans]